jgi:glucosyl-dolichyl phosphate glucuronosyltransferase
MDLSVIICTYNRSASLRRTLESIRGSNTPDHLEWELIVVDNNSDDDSRALVARYQELCSFPVFYVKEQQQGLSYARNCGIHESKGRLIAFTDDDVIADPDWIGCLVKAFAEYEVQCIGGRILPIWEAPKPKWLKEYLYYNVALLDYGNAPLYVETPCVWGANLAFRAEVFEKYGLFDTNRGRVPHKLYGDEETDFIGKLLEHGEKILYLPDAVVHHCISKKRMEKAYFRRCKFDQGELHGILFKDSSCRSIAGIPCFALKRFLGSIWYLAWSTLTFSAESFECQRQAIYTLGFLTGSLKRNSAKADARGE